MLAPLAEGIEPGPRLDFAISSLRMYPEFCRELKELTGIDVGLRQDGILRVVWDEDEASLVLQRLERQRASGLRLEVLRGPEVRTFEPHLSASIPMAVFSADEAQVHTGRLLEALVRACALSGVVSRSETHATGLASSDGRVLGVRLADGTLQAADVTIVAAGAWSAEIVCSAGIDLPVAPVKGQLAELFAPALMLKTVIFSHRGYIVPRGDGSVLVGATEEAAGFNSEPTAAGAHQVIAAGLHLVPALAEAQFRAMRAGFRPASPDRTPIIGAWPGLEGLLIATGHHRNGILLTPSTAAAVADLVLTGTSPLDLTPFSPARLAHS